MTVHIPDEHRLEYRTTEPEDIEQLRLDVANLLATLPQEDVVARVVRAGFGEPFARWYVRLAAMHGSDTHLVLPPEPLSLTMWRENEQQRIKQRSEKSHLRVTGRYFLVGGLVTFPLAIALLGPITPIPELFAIVLIVGRVFDFIGACRLCESKGYPAMTGGTILAFYFPFVIWFLFARDLWEVPEQYPQPPGDVPLDDAEPEAGAVLPDSFSCAPPDPVAPGRAKAELEPATESLATQSHEDLTPERTLSLLERVAELKERGILTDEEAENAKKHFLSQASQPSPEE